MIWEAGTTPYKDKGWGDNLARSFLVGSDGLSLLCFPLRDKTNQRCTSPLLIVSNLLVGVFAFGLFATDIFVNAGQVVTGHLTPYFLTVCKPNYTSTDCRAHHQFINNGNICTGDMEVIEKARRSFPSKHAALSIYSALYATVSSPVLPALPRWVVGWDTCLSALLTFIFLSQSLRVIFKVLLQRVSPA